MNRICRYAAPLVISIWLTTLGWAQTTTANYAGIVVDSSGSIVPGAEVMLRNEGTGAAFTKTTSEDGEFVFNFVPVGTYTLTISRAGFKKYNNAGLRLEAAQNIRQTFTLEVGQVSDTVNVTADAQVINTASPEQRESFSRMQVQELPLALRNFSGILTQSTGITTPGSGKFNLNGLGGAGTRITVDGTEASSDARSSGTSFFNGFNRTDVLSLETIQEVQIIKGVIPAEYGQSLGGNVNVITRSGTNEFHGSLFYNYQGAGFNARNQFTTTKPNSVFNQFGGAVGGPVPMPRFGEGGPGARLGRDKLFFFFAYEGYRESNFLVLNDNVPTPNTRNLMLQRLPFAETKIILDQLPLPNQPFAADAQSARWIGASTSRANDNHYDMKGDWQITNNNRLGVTYTRGHPFSFIPRVSPTNPRTFAGSMNRITSTFTASRSNWTSETRIGFNYTTTNRYDAAFDFKDPNKQEAAEGQRRIAGLVCSRCPFSTPAGEVRNEDPRPFYSAEEKIAVVSGKHTLKFGGSWYLRGSGRFNVESPVLTYLTLDDLLNNIPNQTQFSFGTPKFIGRDYQFALFAQDDWRVTRNLVINLGLRYDYFSNYTAKGEDQNALLRSAALFNPDGLDANFRIGPLRPTDNPLDADKVNFGPRIGFAWDPTGSGRTSIRGGYSLIYMQVPIAHYLLTVGRSPILPFRVIFSRAESAQLGLKFPYYNEDVIPILQKQNITRYTQVFDPNMQNPYAHNYYFGVQQELTKTLMVESAFVMTRGVRFTLRREANQPNRVTGIRPNPPLAGFNYLDDSQRTKHISWQNSVRFRLTDGLNFAAHYTWGSTYAHSGGDAASDAEGETVHTVQDFFCISCEWAPATLDIRHNFNANFVYETPRWANANRFIQSALGTWQVSGIFAARTGTPFNVLQPNALQSQRVDLVDRNNVYNGQCCGFGQLQFLNPAAFAQVPVITASGASARPGTLPAFFLRNPGLWNLNLGLGKNFNVTEKVRFQVRLDAFNALNHTNYTGVRTTITAGDFGRLISTAGARTVQINGRISF
ncbi:MAG TPA: TonB-dependent receptor [Blastocatellia bacterium]|nr:TonB-dependent receptor [Blastocatellia bacterium]